MKNIVKIIRELQSTTKTNEKISILKKNEDNELLKKVLFYTYNPFMKYKMSEKVLEKFEDDFITNGMNWESIFDLLEELNSNNINDNLRGRVKMFLKDKDEDIKEIYKMMILKDLRCNISEKTINKVWKNLIPTFNVMLASKYYDNIKKVEEEEFVLTTKLDGIRCVMWRIGDKVYAYTRQGKEIPGLVDIEKEFIQYIPENLVIDGELLMINSNNLESKDLYRATMKEVRKDGIKKDVIFNTFDILPLSNFKNGKCKTKCIDRKRALHKIFRDNKYKFKFLKEVEPLYFGKDISKVDEFLNKAIKNNEEGIMVNLANAPYECKRTKGILKVKVFNEADVKVVDIKEGTGKNKNKLGNIVVQFKVNDKIFESGVGYGFSDNERELYWNNKQLILNKIVTISYFEISQNEEGTYGLRFAGWTGRIRDDKDEISMY